MTSQLVTEPGFYTGKYLKAGMSYDDEGISDGGKDVPRKIDLASMTKEKLIEEAKLRSVEIDPSKTKAEILAAIEAGSN
ncbi:hypothetical protein AAIH46_17945 [Rhizobium sp. 0TCS1.26]|uniref:hypothetical protein n=1 Tax=Rhizobium sp. 0TCS1.26 TaxID=3142623 RepID=UPI003D28B8DE